ncbi:MAG: RodZ domain-containing protein [Cellvibrio sp.]|uniref:RodZ domain-containing protein n=1 Tax=Cellvibrio sp. TaxID=1965322 RepID=UPI0031AF2F25
MFSDDDKKPLDDNRFRELSPGKLLIWARERAGLNQEQVAKELYMTLTKVRALESDDYRHMGSDTFTRGYLRSYATLVKLDVAQILAAYDRHAQMHGLVEQVLPQRVESANKPLWQFIVLVLVALLVLWLVSIWFFDNRQQQTYDRPAAAAVSPAITSLDIPVVTDLSSSQSSVSDSAVSTAATTEAAVAPEMLQGASSVSPIQANSSISSSAGSVQTQSMVQQPNINSLDKITLSFAQECWLEVSDANGDALISDLQSSGSSITLQGKAPFDVILGNASAAKIELNGDDVTFVPASGTKVLRLKVSNTTRN